MIHPQNNSFKIFRPKKAGTDENASRKTPAKLVEKLKGVLTAFPLVLLPSPPQ